MSPRATDRFKHGIEVDELRMGSDHSKWSSEGDANTRDSVSISTRLLEITAYVIRNTMASKLRTKEATILTLMISRQHKQARAR